MLVNREIKRDDEMYSICHHMLTVQITAVNICDIYEEQKNLRERKTYSETSVSEHLFFEQFSRSPRAFFAVNRPLYSEHLSTLNSEQNFSVPMVKKPSV